MAKKRSGPAAWRRAAYEILSTLDIAAEYAALGCRLEGEPNNGKQRCRAMDREDHNASAVVFLTNADGPAGNYHDSKGVSLSFFEFAAKYGTFASWRDARIQYAKKAGIKLPAGGEESKTPEERIDLEWISFKSWLLRTKSWFKKRPYATVPGVLRCCQVKNEQILIGHYPAAAAEKQSMMVFPLFGKYLTSVGPTGYTVEDMAGGMVRKYRGKGKHPEELKRINLGNGFAGRFGIERLESAEYIWLVEGISDLIALQSLIPEEEQEHHVVIANACGATEKRVPEDVFRHKCFDGKNVFMVKDRDTAGRNGAGVWLGFLLKAGAQVADVELPYSVLESKGKDLRDWLGEIE